MRVAADRLAAVAVVGQQLGLVADADLPHFDPRLKLAGQLPHQLAKIDPVLGQVVDHDPLAAEQVLDVDQLHVELLLARSAAGRSGTRCGPGRSSRDRSRPSSAVISRRIWPWPGSLIWLTAASVASHRTSPISSPRSVRTTTSALRAIGLVAARRKDPQRSHHSGSHDVLGHGWRLRMRADVIWGMGPPVAARV